jgi:DNA invertase Pin-like site-specific DNA recombinase
MAIIIYARVSTGAQADKELSIPAQLRVMRQYAADHGLFVADAYQDVASARTIRGRSGLQEALRRIANDKNVDRLIIYRINRLSRNTLAYLALKAHLARRGVAIVSLVEPVDDSPLGSFLEVIIAAMAELYSELLSADVKLGLEERRRRGEWSNAAPVGYRRVNAQMKSDPLRGPVIRELFERWATGNETARTAINFLLSAGVTNKQGQPIARSSLYLILHNPFYYGMMKSTKGLHAGIHAPLITKELFERAQTVFRHKHSGGMPRRRLRFLLTGLLNCPGCATRMTAEEHRKPSGKVYRYYRCHHGFCGTCIPTKSVDRPVVEQLLRMELPQRLSPLLMRRLTDMRSTRTETTREKLKSLQHHQQVLATRLEDLARVSADFDDLTGDETKQIQGSLKRVEHLLTAVDNDDEYIRGDANLLREMDTLVPRLRSTDIVEQRSAINACVSSVSFHAGAVEIMVTPLCQELLELLRSKSIEGDIAGHPNRVTMQKHSAV